MKVHKNLYKCVCAMQYRVVLVPNLAHAFALYHDLKFTTIFLCPGGHSVYLRFI